MIDDCIFREIEPTITVRKESAAVSYGVIGITADKTKNPDVYHIKTVVRNKEGEYIFQMFMTSILQGRMMTGSVIRSLYTE